MEIQIPFAGFYYSLHDSEAETELEQIADYFADETGRDIPESLMNLFFDAADFGEFRVAYAREYAESFCDEYLTGATFAALTSPKYYNFETDRIFVNITRGHVARLWRNTDRDTFTRIAKERFTSRDGFMSFYRPDWREWGRLSEWDHNQLGTLLLAYLETERGEEWDQWAEYELTESFRCNGGTQDALWSNDKARRAWRIHDYLRERAKRKVKNMVQWRIAYAKPWGTTPLGTIA